MLRRDRRVIAALADRGITDMAAGADGHLDLRPRARPAASIASAGWAGPMSGAGASPDGNPYAHPVNGLHPLVDLNRMELLELGDTHRVDPPPTMGEYVPGLVPGQRLRTDVRPLEISQPEGASFTLDRQCAAAGRNGRCGSASTTARAWSCTRSDYADGGRVRPVAHRLSLAEMVVPYRDPTPDHYRRTAFDIGEWGLGFMTTSLELRLRLPRRDHATWTPSCTTPAGEPYDDPARHLHPRGGRRRAVEARRPARPGPRCAGGGGWSSRFHVDRGQLRVPRLLAVLPGRHDRVRDPGDRHHGGDHVPGGRRRRRTARWSTSGPTRRSTSTSSWPGWTWTSTATPNTVVESHSAALPVGADNPLRAGAGAARHAAADRGRRGKQDHDWATQRSWKVTSTSSPTASARRSGYKLVPGGCFPAMFDESSPVFRRAEVIGHTLWVTPYASGRAVAVRRVLQPERA